MLDVAQDLGLGGIALGPLPFAREVIFEAVLVFEAFDVAASPGVAVPVPRTANIVAGLDHDGAHAHAAKTKQLVKAGKPRANNNGIDGFRQAAGNPGRFGGKCGHGWILGSVAMAGFCRSGRVVSTGPPRRADAQALRGKRTVKAAPCGSRFSTETVPRCASTIARTIARPRPDPPSLRARPADER